MTSSSAPTPASATPESNHAVGDDGCDTSRHNSGALDVRCEAFSGPVDLLLELVAQRRVEINEISVAQIVDDYLALVDSMRGLDLDHASKFLLVAATLIQIKTRRLLPAEDDIEIDEELLVDAERDVFLARLLTARTFADVAGVLRDALADGARYTPRRVAPEPQLRHVAPDLLRQVQAPDLARIAASVLAEKDSPHLDVSHIQPIRVSVTDTVMQLVADLPRSGPASYRRMCARLTRIEAVVKFLALLELLKSGVIAVEQAALNDDIVVRWVADTDFDVVTTAEWDLDISDRAAGDDGVETPVRVADEMTPGSGR